MQLLIFKLQEPSHVWIPCKALSCPSNLINWLNVLVKYVKGDFVAIFFLNRWSNVLHGFGPTNPDLSLNSINKVNIWLEGEEPRRMNNIKHLPSAKHVLDPMKGILYKLKFQQNSRALISCFGDCLSLPGSVWVSSAELWRLTKAVGSRLPPQGWR